MTKRKRLPRAFAKQGWTRCKGDICMWELPTHKDLILAHDYSAGEGWTLWREGGGNFIQLPPAKLYAAFVAYLLTQEWPADNPDEGVHPIWD